MIERGPGAIANPPVESQEVSPPGGAQTAATKTWALRQPPARARARFVWELVPVKPGTYTLHFAYAAGLSGKSKVRLAVGSQRGSITVHVAGKPPATHVNPETGKVEAGPLHPALGSRNLLTAAGLAGCPNGADGFSSRRVIRAWLPWHYDCAGAHAFGWVPPPTRRASRHRRNR